MLSRCLWNTITHWVYVHSLNTEKTQQHQDHTSLSSPSLPSSFGIGPFTWDMPKITDWLCFSVGGAH